MLGLVYLALFIFSAVFALGAFLFGHDHEASVDHDVSADHDTDHGMPSVFSSRVLSLFLLGFSGSGLVAYYAWGLEKSSPLIGLGFGLILGALAYLFISIFYREQASSSPDADDYVGVEARVSANIPPNGTGEITLPVRGQLRTVFAVVADGSPIPEGRSVKVIRMSGATATVELLK